MTRHRYARAIPPVAVALGLLAGAVGQAAAQQPSQGQKLGHAAQHKNMKLVGHNDLQARSAYQPFLHEQGGRWIAYVGHHGGTALNPMTGVLEGNGTSIVDVTDPSHPVYLKHLPGGAGAGEAGGSQMIHVCNGRDLPRGDPSKVYMLRTVGNTGHEIIDVTMPEAATLTPVSTVLAGENGTHKNWWECSTGIAFLAARHPSDGWRQRHMKVFDLSDPANPVFIRDFGLTSQRPGATVLPVEPSHHGAIVLGNRVYVPYGTSSNGILQILDRDRLVNGDPALGAARYDPTEENLLYPQIGRLNMSPDLGGHSSFPVLGIEVADFAKNTQGRVRDYVLLTSESTSNECREFRHMSFMVDITTPSRPYPISNLSVAESSGDFCDRGGRFGAHSSNESFTEVFYKKMVFIAFFNAGVRAFDIRDPYNPKEAAYYIPATTANTDERCITVGGVTTCKIAIQTNNVEVDDRGFIYLADRANTGLHIVELTGSARQIANLP